MSAPIFAGDSEPWMVDALCLQVDPELFFPEKGESARVAKRVCAVCPVTLSCLAFAFAHQEAYGVFGGLSARERWNVGRAARIAGAA